MLGKRRQKMLVEKRRWKDKNVGKETKMLGKETKKKRWKDKNVVKETKMLGKETKML